MLWFAKYMYQWSSGVSIWSKFRGGGAVQKVGGGGGVGRRLGVGDELGG